LYGNVKDYVGLSNLLTSGTGAGNPLDTIIIQPLGEDFELDQRELLEKVSESITHLPKRKTSFVMADAHPFTQQSCV
jgi:hypothetical protein